MYIHPAQPFHEKYQRGGNDANVVKIYLRKHVLRCFFEWSVKIAEKKKYHLCAIRQIKSVSRDETLCSKIVSTF